jgi:hypothetical protein
MGRIDDQPTTAEGEAYQLLAKVGNRANIPVRYIRFACDIAEVESVYASDGSFHYEKLTMHQLSLLFASFGLPVSNTHTAKYLNDRTSSAYHNWQRTSLGAALTVSDIDLWRLRDTGEPETVFELKRSHFDLNRWQPFKDDYRNFRLISNLCNAAGLNFKIIYNQRVKTPFADKIDKLKIFTVDFSKPQPIVENGIIPLNQLENL